MLEGPPREISQPFGFYIRQFADAVNAAARESGASLQATSWWRSDARNALVGGARNSQHLLGLAVDLVPRSNGSAFMAAARARTLVVIPEGDHLHVQHAPGGAWDGWISLARRHGLLGPPAAAA